jgi:hypothetical protein
VPGEQQQVREADQLGVAESLAVLADEHAEQVGTRGAVGLLDQPAHVRTPFPLDGVPFGVGQAQVELPGTAGLELGAIGPRDTQQLADHQRRDG